MSTKYLTMEEAIRQINEALDPSVNQQDRQAFKQQLEQVTGKGKDIVNNG